jgi:lipopolysaccharide transport system ATP-binding protein
MTQISVKNLYKTFHVSTKVVTTSSRLIKKRETMEISALSDISFSVQAGERIGIIGRNGSGKSTLLKIMSGLMTPSRGTVTIYGRTASLLELGTGFDDNLTGLQNIYNNATLLGFSHEEIREQLPSIIEFSMVGELINMPIRYYSTGMRARLAFSVAAHLKVDNLMLDEILSVGDNEFAQKALGRINEMTAQVKTLVFVSHAIDSVNKFCDRALWLERGEIVEDGPAEDVTSKYLKSTSRLSPIATVSHPKNGLRLTTIETFDHFSRAEAPSLESNSHAFLTKISIHDANGKLESVFAADKTLEIQASFEVTSNQYKIVPFFRVLNWDGILLFNTFPIDDSVLETISQPGRYTASVSIPGGFLNLGKHHVSVGLNSPTSSAVIRHHEIERVLSFSIVEVPQSRTSARGVFRAVPGMLRPVLDWQVRVTEDS